MVKRELLGALEDLPEKELKRFQWHLRQDVLEGFPPIPRSRLENADRHDIVDEMVQTYTTDGALKISVEILTLIERNDLVIRLTRLTSQAASLHPTNNDQPRGNAHDLTSLAPSVRLTHSDQTRDAEFVDTHRSALIQRVRSVMPIADDLIQEKMIHMELYDEILVTKTSQGRMRLLYTALTTGQVKSAFYRTLMNQEPHLLADLYAEFVDRNRPALIQRVTSVMAIADDLYQKNMIHEEMYHSILATKTRQEQMRLLYVAVTDGGLLLKSAFYRILKNEESNLLTDLESVEKQRARHESEFLEKHGDDLIKRVRPSSVMTIAADLLKRECILEQFYHAISATPPENQMGVLYYGAIKSAEQNVKSAFYRNLESHDPDLLLDLDEGFIHVGPRISCNPYGILGHGSGGTIVIRGYFNSAVVLEKTKVPVAVKRIQKQNVGREVQLLAETYKQPETHPNIIRYYITEEDANFYYIALELCDKTLEKFIEAARTPGLDPPGLDPPGLDPVTLSLQLMSGLQYLHCKLETVHRDLKPQNILLSMPSKEGKVIIKISDFGMSKKQPTDKKDVSISRVLGTEGWAAPELLDKKTKNSTNAVDIFSAGCVFYYVVTKGTHPFDEDRDANITKGKYNLEALKMDKHDDIVTRDLVEKMLNKDPDKRPSAETVLKHPFFWSNKTILDFLQEAHGWTKKETVELLESGAQEVVRGDWMEHIGEVLKNDLEKQGKYDGGSVKSLLRAIRNKAQHYADSPEEVQRTLGSVPDGFVSFFTSRFPRLLLHTYLAGGGSS